MRPRSLCALALLLGCFLSACASPPAPAEEPGERPLVVASDLDNMPFAGVDEDGTPVGRDVEMMQTLAEHLDRELSWKRIPFETLLPSAQAGLVDVVCATVGITPERADKVAFSEPYFETVISVVVRSGAGEPRRWADLDGERVAAGAGTTSERAVRRVLPDAVGVFENKRGLSAAERLLVGDVDGVAMDGPNADDVVAASAGSLRLLDTPLTIERYGLAFPQQHRELRSALDRALATMEHDGSMAALNAKWGLDKRAR